MAANEKDRLGDKLRDVERAREDQYFKERDRKLLDQMRKSKGLEGEDDLAPQALGLCPKCGVRLQQRDVDGVTVDECPSCAGMWLDHGELKAIADREDNGWIARWLRLEFKKKP
jgi:hypothetical protein